MLDKKKRKQTYEDNTENVFEENLSAPPEDCVETQGCLPQEETEEKTDQETAPEKSEAEKLQEQIDLLNEKLLRTMAEYDNYRKRSTKEKDSIYPLAKSDTVEKFLPIMDNFERAMECTCTDIDFKKGVEMIWGSFLQIMKDLSVEEIGTEGEAFNPEIHNAVMHVEDEDYGENVVMQVLQKGYRIGDRVVRYAMVKVAN